MLLRVCPMGGSKDKQNTGNDSKTTEQENGTHNSKQPKDGNVLDKVNQSESQLDCFVVKKIPHLCNDPNLEAIWHLFIWAVLSNEKEIAEYFLNQTTSIIGDIFNKTQPIADLIFKK